MIWTALGGLGVLVLLFTAEVLYQQHLARKRTAEAYRQALTMAMSGPAWQKMQRDLDARS